MTTVAIIPAYNEEAHIAQVIAETMQFVQHVLVVDDGSRDLTQKRAEAAGAIVLHHAVNMGKGIALKTGFEAAQQLNPDVIITIDGDGQHDPKEIPRFIGAMKYADIIIGERQLNRDMPLVFKIGNFVLHKAFLLLFGASIHDTQSGYRAFKRDIYGKIRWDSNGYSVETEMLIKAIKNGLVCREIPVKTVYLNAVKGTTIIDGVKIFLDMLLWKLKG